MLELDKVEWYKENRAFSKAIIKYGDEYEIDAEELGYKIFKQLNIPTPELYERTKNSIIIEQLNGPSIFEVCKQAIQKNAKEEIILTLLDTIQKDIILFQEYTTEHLSTETINLYDSNHKFRKSLDLLKHTDVKAYNKIIPYLDDINNIFEKYSTVPFRDATLKNILLKDINIDIAVESILDGDISTIINNRKHIDFRSLCEKTTVYDDVISIYYHSIFSKNIINSFEQKYLNRSIDNIEFITTKLIRLSRFWGRRQYYYLENKEYNKRYKGENINFYKESFIQTIDDFIKII